MTDMTLSRFTIALLPFVAHAVLGAGVLWRRSINRSANRWLAALLVVVALRTLPYVLGFSGAYDRYQWLTFAPFDWTLAIGPLIYGYVITLTTARPPARFWRHFVPLAVQLAYSLVAFALPLDAKWAWYTGVHLNVIEPVGLAASMLSVAAYLVATRRQLTQYDAWLRSQLSDIEPVRLGWLYHMLSATWALLAMAAVFALYHLLVSPLDYFARFPLIVAVGLLADVLAALGWKHAETHLTALTATTLTEPTLTGPTLLETSDDQTSDSRYASLAAEWAGRLETEGWFRDDGLTLALLARRVGVSERTASRVLSEGLGQSFHQFVNAARVRAVMVRLADPAERADVLPIALDAGFSSKASFNRVFRELTGTTPTSWRATALSENRLPQSDDPT